MLVGRGLSRAQLSDLLSPCLRGMRQNLVPGLLLQLVALTILLLYAFAMPLRPWFVAIGSAKQQYGYWYSATSTALFGGLIPYLILLGMGRLQRGKRLSSLFFYLGFWVWKGIEVDALYRLQAVLFGSAATLGVIAQKTFIDQFVYNPLWAVPTQVWCFLWKDSNYSRAKLQQKLLEESMVRRSLVLLVSTWIVWIPTVSIIYALPNALQIPLSNLAVCFWCLLMTSISRGEN